MERRLCGYEELDMLEGVGEGTGKFSESTLEWSIAERTVRESRLVRVAQWRLLCSECGKL